MRRDPFGWGILLLYLWLMWSSARDGAWGWAAIWAAIVLVWRVKILPLPRGGE